MMDEEEDLISKILEGECALLLYFGATLVISLLPHLWRSSFASFSL